jgi:hypothetical protein
VLSALSAPLEKPAADISGRLLVLLWRGGRTRVRAIASAAALSISLTAAIHLPISFDQANRIKADIKMVKTDSKTKMVVRNDRKLAASGRPDCYV